MDERSIGSFDLSFPTDFEGSSNSIGLKNDISQDDGTTFVRNAVRHERRAVACLRGISLSVLVVAAVIVSVSIYVVFTSAEEKTFESKALDSGQFAIQNFLRHLELKMWITYTKSVTITSSLSSINAVSQAPEEIANYYFDVESFGLQNLDNSPLTLSLLIHNDAERKSWEGWATQFSFLNVYNEKYGDEIVGSSIINAENPSADTAAARSLNRTIEEGIYRFSGDNPIDDNSPGPWFPIWQVSPQSGHNTSIMFNQLSDPNRRAPLEKLISTKSPVMSNIITGPNQLYPSKNRPRSILFYPVLDNFRYGRLIGSISMEFMWEEYFNYFQFPGFSKGTIVVVESSCGDVLSFKVSGSVAEFLGDGDLHDPSFDYLEQASTYDQYAEIIRAGAVLSHDYNVSGECLYRARSYPSEEFKSKYVTSVPKHYALVVAAIFLFTIAVFVAYDCMRERLQNKVMNTAIRSNAIVNSIFPAVVRDRMFRTSTRQTDDDGRHLFTTKGPSTTVVKRRTSENVKFRLKSFLSLSSSGGGNMGQQVDPLTIETDEPIADLFPNTTVMFADIVGFTAWSSEREPSQVFTLLETLYRAFDSITKRRGVFKVETIGDCYVAVTGLPDPNNDHALVMARFAYECLKEMTVLTKRLESTLGPGTADLSMRFGLHSGAVTAGVLRGEKSRFQLFGDTVNTAARMEETSGKNKIQLSPTTAKLLEEAKRSHWLLQREEPVEVKGKGKMQTFWLKLAFSQRREDSMAWTPSVTESAQSRRPSIHCPSVCDSTKVLDSPWGNTCIDLSDRTTTACFSSKDERLIEWNTEMLHGLLTKIAVKRTLTDNVKKPFKKIPTGPADPRCHSSLLDEVTEVITLPKFDPSGVDKGKLVAELSPLVRNQLHEYVRQIAGMYRDVPFHNFEHASHVTMSATKLLKRILNPDDAKVGANFKRKNTGLSLAKAIHECTFGLSSDPLAQFAIVFSALIHDADHTGVPNNQLIKENDMLAVKYGGKSVAEQHSVTCAWELLMDERYNALRSCIFTSDTERDRFRQLLVNATLATDICDQQLQGLRKKRWDKAFQLEPSESPQQEEFDEDKVNRKATIVIEHLIQASDVAHTMQHWHVYRKWNELLFHETYAAYKAGRADEDPSISWYRGELGFFDGYIIPLARKLEKCGIFGVSSDEYLTYALENRHEWEMKGEGLVADMMAKYSRPAPPAAA